MRLCAVIIFVFSVSCVAENTDPYLPTSTPMIEDPYPYDDFVYGDSFLDEDHDGESTEFDCNDENPFVWTGAEEICNSIDDNCNGKTDERDGCF